MRGLTWGLMALAAFAALPAGAQEMPHPPMPLPDGTLLEIAAEGHSTRVPDMAVIQAGVVTQAPTAAAALAQNNAQMARVNAALRAAGVAERDIQTANISLQPQYRERKNGEPQEIYAYQAQNRVTIRFRDVAKAGGILDILVREGSNTVSGPDLVTSQPMEALNEARVDAVAKARARAELYARAAGLRVERILSISDAASRGYEVMGNNGRYAGVMNAAEISAGEQDINVTVTMRFLLK
ncbi:MAG: SIMPL domain-containing protein [Pseudomonadota bacterium]